LQFHSNRLTNLPATFAILTNLTVLDLSENKLVELPPAMFSLPNLTTLNLTHNELTSLPFSKFGIPIEKPASMSDDGYFEPAVFRSDQPLPKLHTLDVSFNKLTAKYIDSEYLPANIVHLTLSNNPLGDAANLINALAKLEKLQELHIAKAQIGDDSFVVSTPPRFPKLRILDLDETQVSEHTLRSFFNSSPRANDLSFDVTSSEPQPGQLRAVVGKKVVKEQWEIEADQRYLRRKKSIAAAMSHSSSQNGTHEEPVPVMKEPWEVEAEQGLLTEGGRRRVRAVAAAEASTAASSSSSVGAQDKIPSPPPRAKTPVVEKEQWEIEAEQGLLTEGGRRRARALAQAAAAESSKSPSNTPTPSSLASSSYYSAQALTLTLPPSAPPSRMQARGHTRVFSLAAPAERNSPKGNSAEDLSIPTPTLPLSLIVSQSFASTLRVLVLSKRRADPSFTLPTSELIQRAAEAGGVLPNLDELYLDGCNLGDTVSVSETSPDQPKEAPSKAEKLNTIETIARVFPSLSLLDLSYNAFSSENLTPSILNMLLLPSNESNSKGRGLKVLRLRGNRLTSLDAFENVAGLFKGNRQMPEWRLEELDVRDNDISKLPATLGLLPLDVFLVDGNT
jgi:Leucine-rich repeat (LRR) protein